MFKLKEHLLLFYKILRNYSLYLLSFLIPRDKKKWVFANYIIDAFNDNPKYLFIYVNQYCPDINAIYITPDPGVYIQLNKLGLKVYRKKSLRGIWHCLTAKVYFYNAYPADVNYYTSGCAILVNLWHGVGLKKIEFNIERGTLAERYQKKSFFIGFIRLGYIKDQLGLFLLPNFNQFRFQQPFVYHLKNVLISATQETIFYWLPKMSAYVSFKNMNRRKHYSCSY